MSERAISSGFLDFRTRGLDKSSYVTVLNLRAFLTMVAISLFPGTASALTIEALELGRAELVIPLILLLELPIAIWASGFMGADDRRTIRNAFGNLLSLDLATMSPQEIVSHLFWGENSVTALIFRIWLAVAAAMVCSLALGQLEPVMALRYGMPGIIYLIMSFSLFSYIFIRNICEECIRSQIGHAVLSTVFTSLMCAGIYHFG